MFPAIKREEGVAEFTKKDGFLEIAHAFFTANVLA